MFQSTKMLSVVVRVALFVLVLNYCVKPCIAYKNYNLYTRDKGQTNNNQQSGDYNAMSSNIPDDTRRGLGISAWGIIFVVLTIILIIIAAYYFAICYPVCKKRRNHNIKYDNVI